MGFQKRVDGDFLEIESTCLEKNFIGSLGDSNSVIQYGSLTREETRSCSQEGNVKIRKIVLKISLVRSVDIMSFSSKH